MRIRFLGHAGFLVETAEATIVMDPWLSPQGAFDSAWFQFPRNHHLADAVQGQLEEGRKARFLYVSHEHKDHLDLDFLARLRSRDFTVVVPRFRRTALREQLAAAGLRVLACDDRQEVPFPGGHLKLLVDDSELNRDSAILLRAGGRSFLNLNDCKLHDGLARLAEKEAPIDVFTCQFSGATWHPTCYEYPEARYSEISERKMLSKFEGVAHAIEALAPRVFFPSAGPPCFLDPALLHLNFEPFNTFPRASRLMKHLRARPLPAVTRLLELAPGDELDATSGEVSELALERLAEEEHGQYIRRYARDHAALFAALPSRPADPEETLRWLGAEFERKLANFTLGERVRVPLYFCLQELPDRRLRIDFTRRAIELAPRICEESYYSIEAPAWQVAGVLDRRLTWEDFALTFRMRLRREPDIYRTALQGFLLMEAEDQAFFCQRLRAIRERRDRVVVTAGSSRFTIDRYCPHQGADLSEGWLEEGKLWTCPRHRWQFDLTRGGDCQSGDGSIHAVPEEDANAE